MAKVWAFLVCVFLWFMFVLGAVVAPELVEAFWEWVRSLPWWLEGPVWFLTLPWMLGLWVWNSSWDLGLRIVVIAVIAVANLLSFNPWTGSEARRPAPPLTPRAV